MSHTQIKATLKCIFYYIIKLLIFSSIAMENKLEMKFLISICISQLGFPILKHLFDYRKRSKFFTPLGNWCKSASSKPCTINYFLIIKMHNIHFLWPLSFQVTGICFNETWDYKNQWVFWNISNMWNNFSLTRNHCSTRSH